MSSQTKGPWRAVASGLRRSGLPEFEIHWSDKGECVAEIVHGEEAARLIAASPDLLAACEESLECLRIIKSENGGLGQRLSAAIAKAKGASDVS